MNSQRRSSLRPAASGTRLRCAALPQYRRTNYRRQLRGLRIPASRSSGSQNSSAYTRHTGGTPLNANYIAALPRRRGRRLRTFQGESRNPRTGPRSGLKIASPFRRGPATISGSNDHRLKPPLNGYEETEGLNVAHPEFGMPRRELQPTPSAPKQQRRYRLVREKGIFGDLRRLVRERIDGHIDRFLMQELIEGPRERRDTRLDHDQPAAGPQNTRAASSKSSRPRQMMQHVEHRNTAKGTGIERQLMCVAGNVDPRRRK